MGQQSIPPNVGTGLIKGRVMAHIADGADADVEPDVIQATGRVVLTPSVPYLQILDPGPGEDPVTYLMIPITLYIDEQGYVCRPNTQNPGTPGDREIRVIAHDTPAILVHDWTYKVEYFFDQVNGVKPVIETHSIAVTVGSVNDLTAVAKVPESPGIGEDQAPVLIAQAQAFAAEARQAALDALAAADAAVAAAEAAATATEAATPSTIALRDSTGGLTGTQVSATAAAPSLPEHLTRMDYVDAAIAGRAPVDANGKIPTSALPALAVIDTFTAATQAEMLALTAQRGDMCIRTDSAVTYVLTADTPSVLSAWKELMAAGQVTSVNGQTGTVQLGKSDVGLGAVNNTGDADKPVSTATQTALDGKANITHTHDITAIIGWRKSWIEVPTISADFPAWSAATAPRIKKELGRVYCSGTLRAITAGTMNNEGTAVFNIPAGYLPSTVDDGASFVCQGSGADRWTLQVQGGIAYARRYGPGAQASGNWLPFSVSWDAATP